MWDTRYFTFCSYVGMGAIASATAGLIALKVYVFTKMEARFRL